MPTLQNARDTFCRCFTSLPSACSYVGGLATCYRWFTEGLCGGVHMQRSQRKALLFSSSLIAVGYGAGWHKAHQPRPEGSTRHGLFTASQVERMAARLVPMTAPGTTMCRCGVEYSESRLASKPLSHTWTAACADAGGHDVIFFVWNADNGHLLQAVSSLSLEDEASTMTAEQATTQGRFWLQRLGMVPASAQWRLGETPECINRSWRLRFWCGAQQASVNLTASGGNLRFAKIW